MKKKLVFMFTAAVFLISSMSMVVSASAKSLNLRETDGQLYYDSADSVSPDIFVLSPSMEAGKVYEETLNIGNQTKDTYELFLRLLPVSEQSGDARKLLSMVQMKITLEDQVLYEGSADGLVSVGGTLDSTKLTSIGKYTPKENRMLHVEYQFNGVGNVIIEKGYYIRSEYESWRQQGFAEDKRPASYRTQEEAAAAADSSGDSDIIYLESSQQDELGTGKAGSVSATSEWRFYAEKVSDTKVPADPVKPVKPGPKTGDDQNVMIYVVVGAAALVILGVIQRKKKTVI